MYSSIKTVTFDCADALVTARFWAATLGSNVDEDPTFDTAYVEAAGWGGPEHVVQPGSRGQVARTK